MRARAICSTVALSSSGAASRVLLQVLVVRQAEVFAQMAHFDALTAILVEATQA